MTLSIASLGIKVTTDGVQQAASDLDKLGKSSTTAASTVGKVAPQMERAALSAKQLQQATRQLPMQFTDIFTGLATGQKPLQVLLQQGGQLKDTFGGIGPALRASAGYIAALISPATLAAGAFVALGAAWNANASALSDFNVALAQTGGFAGKTAQQLRDMTGQLDTLDGVTRGGASEALLSVAKSGRFAGEQFEQVARAAALMKASTGQAVDETVKKFVELGREPVQALVKLNETEHFLTRTQFDRIRALIEEGRQQDAAAEAIRAYSEHLSDVSNKARESLPAISRWWGDIKDATSGATGEISTYMGLLERVIQRQGEVRKPSFEAAFPQLSLVPDWATNTTLINALGKSFLQSRAGPAPVDVQWAGIYGPMDSTAAKDLLDQDEERRKLRERFMADELRYLDESARKRREISEVNDLVTKGIIKQEEATKRISQIEESYARRTAKKKDERTQEQKDRDRILQQFESQNASLARQIALYNDRSRVAAASYDIELKGLDAIDKKLADQIRDRAYLLDMMDYMDEADTIIRQNALEAMRADYTEAFKAVEVAADQASRNIQDSFADFLFDPFADGLDGMFESFATTLRRMAAEVMAAQILQQFTAVGGSTGIVGDLIGLFRGGWGYADGGYTGPGGKYQPAGVVHKGEVVWSQSDVARAGGVGVVEAMRRGLRGYANGGPVGIRAPTAGGPSVEINIENKSGTRMEAQTSDLRFDGKKWVTSIVLEAIGSGQADSVAGQRWGVRPRGYANG
ncbi:phage tail length tape measure family protein [Pseudoxanthomonas taiwanensis]|uniref:Phage-related minor tail protein n=1 Tax=Pseudoxanthomonas taiwanensis J19 TaxID=935569 RepID=A0A562D7N0_9GAMM|nr:phage tail length tape measure family protein [Pseudoxanthomonas taiwanensis]TWH05608.1 phage-related minor tail protein [Pseudoxanthomonas taiwanensis J19]